ncbi:hypothetical protein HELRODRAFT_172521 [Helobdella robusta]|uniref:Uncharacterized protein n=1 Tax=Helobdella robusta TaxID=6412 RepID=T1F5G3_HELRO|nr:hypothetical protein HELRODRAFT_172521 [Helobdella robusta]ESO04178.1 hypothetical protein HELRODRAFT_172521 [Helobdella robusta]
MDSIRRFIESLKTRRIRKPTIAAICTTLFSNILTIVVMSTDYWERTDFYRLDTIPNLFRNESILDEGNGFYSLKLLRVHKLPLSIIRNASNSYGDNTSTANDSFTSNNNNYINNINNNINNNNIHNNNHNNNIMTPFTTTATATATTTSSVVTSSASTTAVTSTALPVIQVVLRARSGGIWQICDHITEKFRTSSYFEDILRSNPSFRTSCYNYIRDYEKSNMTEKGIAIIRMQNSAVSCVIVCLLCMLTSLCTGMFSIWREQVAVCMQQDQQQQFLGDCLTIDGPLPHEVCQKTVVQMSWSMMLVHVNTYESTRRVTLNVVGMHSNKVIATTEPGNLSATLSCY